MILKNVRTMKFYPIFVNVKDRLCTVVGGGEVAERKVKRLLECGARVVVVSSEITEGLAKLRDAGLITHISEEYRSSHIKGSFLVIGATNRRETNKKISADCRRENVLVNIVDSPDECDFIVPSVLTRGDLTVAISTGGRSPALARRIREELETTFGEEYAVLSEILGRLRVRVKSQKDEAKANRDVFYRLLETDILEAIKKRDWSEVRRIIKEVVGEDTDIVITDEICKL
ncbi:MAG: bifunctional precorrin-2 dehydrogenase/sirohydrochlorin ferrochelatase [Syntrophales bacterium]|nr:bifunctional precorrin-2 dehydrogenase/sirohydrochlorin ferrochelatase [Syntrophales bacterium]